MAPPRGGAASPAPRFPLLARAAPPLLALAVVAFVALFAQRPFRSFDTYFHLRFGDELASGRWSLADPGQPSTTSTGDWVPTQWLAQVTLARTEAGLGKEGLSVLFAVLLVALAVTLYWAARSRGGPVVAVTLAGASLVAIYPWLSLRPQMVSFVLTGLVVTAWESVRRGGRTPWWLVPIGWVWACSHGMWVMGVGISAVAVVGLVVERRPDRATTLRWAAVPAGMLLAALVTPVGPRLVAAVLLVNSRGDHFAEWAVPELLTPKGAWACALLATATLALVLRKRAAPYDVALLALGAVLALYSWRTVPLAATVLLPLVAGLGRTTVPPVRPAAPRVEHGAVLVAGLLTVLLCSVRAGDLDPGEAERLDPFGDRLADAADGTVVVTDTATGAALLWRAPHLDVPVHGYGDVYTDDELDDVDDLLSLQPGWDDTVREYGAEDALLPPDDRLAYALRLAGWTATEETEDLVWLTAPAGWSDSPAGPSIGG